MKFFNLYFILIIAVGLSGCKLSDSEIKGSIGGTPDQSSDPPPSNSEPPPAQADPGTATGWLKIYAVGPKTNKLGQYILANGSTTGDINSSDKEVTLTWTAPVSTATGWNIYRSTTSGGQDFNTPLNGTLITDGARSYTDTTVTPGETYYYAVRAVIGGNDEAVSGLNEIRIVVPPNNMALVHRWSVNREICSLLPTAAQDSIDPNNHFRCNFAGTGGDGTYFDMGYDYLVDRFESGCNYTEGNACGGGVCYGAAVPAMAASAGTVYWENDTYRCYVNTDGGTTWKNQTALSTVAEYTALGAGSNSGFLSPLGYMRQTISHNVCKNQTITLASGGPITKKLLSIKEWRAAAAWGDEWTHPEIEAIEAGGTVANTEYCNSKFSHGGNDSALADKVGYPGQLFRTGSVVATNKCQSRYGIQDLIGNVYEWTNDQCEFAGGSICTTASSPLEPTNTEMIGYNNPLSSWDHVGQSGFFNPVIGFAFGSDLGGLSIVTNTTDFLHGDLMPGGLGTGDRGLLLGGSYWDEGYGRWSGYWRSPTITFDDVGFRCGAVLP